MKQKRLLSLLLAMLLLLPTHALAAGEQELLWHRFEPGGKYVTIRLEYPEGENLRWAEQNDLVVRYADSKQVIPLSSVYSQGYIFVTVPVSTDGVPPEARPGVLEVFQGTPTQFQDCTVSWEYNGGIESLYDPPFGTEELNIRSLFLGDDRGKLNAEQTITRAEAFTVILRLMGDTFQSDVYADYYYATGKSTGFKDVEVTDWFYATALDAIRYELTEGTEYFYPDRPVTRGEITVMLARAMKEIGWLIPEDDERAAYDLTLADRDDIPDWAYDAYYELAPYNVGIFTYRESGEIDEFGAYKAEAVAECDRLATREEVIELIYDALRWMPVYPTQTAIEWGFDKAMPAIDGSTSTLPYTNAVYGALFRNYTHHPDLPAQHSKSYYSYEQLINGNVDVLFISTKPTEDTLEKAKAAGVELELIPIAHDAMVFFTNGENSIEGLTMAQIRDIYVDNNYTNWSQLDGPDAGLIPYCRNADSGSQAQMEEFFLKGDVIHEEIRRETTAISMASVLTDVWQAKTEDPLAYALGYSIYYYYQQASMILLPDQDTLKLLKIEGVYPTDETIADGSYPLAGYNYAVVRADAPEDSIGRRMVEFMLSETGQQCVINAGFGALN